MNAHLKKIILAAGILITLMLIISGSGFVLRAARAQTASALPLKQSAGDQIRKVTVTGTAQVQVQPDTALISLGVETNADTASAALTQNNQQMQTLIEALAGGGIAREDIQTQTVQLYPRYSNQTTETQTTPAIVGYTARNTVSLVVRDIAQAGQVLDNAVNAGGNTINSIQFIVSDPTESLNSAREQAMENALQKAEQLAGLAEASLGSILEIMESPSPVSPGIIIAGVQDTAREAVPIEPGTQTVSLDLQVTWQLLDSASSGTSPAGTQQGGGQTGTGTATSSRLSISPIRGTPGSVVLVRGQGFPANATVSLAVGRSATETTNVSSIQADEDGIFSAQVTIPESAEVNERWLVVATTGEGSQATAVTSNTFTISGP